MHTGAHRPRFVGAPTGTEKAEEIAVKIEWRQVSEALRKHTGHQYSQGVCNNIADELNNQVRLSDVEEVEETGHLMSAEQRADLDSLATHREWNCTFENPCAACQDKRPHPHDEVVHLTDQKPPGKPVLHAAYCACRTCLGAGVV